MEKNDKNCSKNQKELYCHVRLQKASQKSRPQSGITRLKNWIFLLMEISGSFEAFFWRDSDEIHEKNSK